MSRMSKIREFVYLMLMSTIAIFILIVYRVRWFIEGIRHKQEENL